MKRIIGAIFLAASAVLLYQFGVQGAFHAQGAPSASFSLPFESLGAGWPGDTLLFLGGAWALLLGLALVFTAAPKPPLSTRAEGGSAASRYAAAAAAGRNKGFVAKTMLLNSMLMISAFFVAFIGAKTGQDARTIGAFAAVGLLQIVFGLILLILSLMERPKGPISLALGLLLWLGGSAAGVIAFIQGG